jgi:hypothetical protein
MAIATVLPIIIVVALAFIACYFVCYFKKTKFSPSVAQDSPSIAASPSCSTSSFHTPEQFPRSATLCQIKEYKLIPMSKTMDF